jgi:hypothetical protein
MRCLSLWQPFASLVVSGAKAIETRSWRTSYRGPLAIHAGRKQDPQCLALCYEEPFRSALAAAGIARPAALPLGAILGVVELHGCCPVEELTAFGDLDARERAFGDYRAGRFGWLLREPRRLATPVPCRGFQSLFDVPDGLVAVPA